MHNEIGHRSRALAGGLAVWHGTCSNGRDVAGGITGATSPPTQGGSHSQVNRQSAGRSRAGRGGRSSSPSGKPQTGADRGQDRRGSPGGEGSRERQARPAERARDLAVPWDGGHMAAGPASEQEDPEQRGATHRSPPFRVFDPRWPGCHAPLADAPIRSAPRSFRCSPTTPGARRYPGRSPAPGTPVRTPRSRCTRRGE